MKAFSCRLPVGQTKLSLRSINQQCADNDAIYADTHTHTHSLIPTETKVAHYLPEHIDPKITWKRPADWRAEGGEEESSRALLKSVFHIQSSCGSSRFSNWKLYLEDCRFIFTIIWNNKVVSSHTCPFSSTYCERKTSGLYLNQTFPIGRSQMFYASLNVGGSFGFIRLIIWPASTWVCYENHNRRMIIVNNAVDGLRLYV